jgi:hypothetical protein
MQAPDAAGQLRKTRHAQIRQAQRSVPDIAAELLLKFGSSSPSHDGTERYYFSDKDWKKVKRHFGTWMPNKSGQLRNIYMVVGSDGAVITFAYQH